MYCFIFFDSKAFQQRTNSEHNGSKSFLFSYCYFLTAHFALNVNCAMTSVWLLETSKCHAQNRGNYKRLCVL